MKTISAGAYYYLVSAAMLAGLILFADVRYPHGITFGVPYIAVILVCIRAYNRVVLISATVICTTFMALGHYLAPPSENIWQTNLNHLLVLLATWFTCFVGLYLIHTRNALNSNSEKLRNIIQDMPNFICVLSTEGIITEINKAPLARGNSRREDIIGLHLKDTYWWSHSADVQSRLTRSLEKVKSGEMVRYDENIRLNTDHFIFIDVVFSPLYDNENHVYQIVASAIDISARKKAENAIQQSEKEFRQLVEDTNVLSWEASINTTQFSYVSPQAEKITGYTPEQWYQPDFWPQHIHPDDRDWVVSYCKESTSREEDHVFEYRLLKANGDIIWIYDNVKIVRNEIGTPVKLRGVMIDITKQKKAEQELAFRRNQILQNQKILIQLAKEDFPDQKTAFEKIIRADAEQLGVARVSFWFFNDTRNEAECVTLYQQGDPKEEKLVLRDSDYPRYFKALEEEGYIAADDAVNNPHTGELAESYLIPGGISSMMDIPVRLQGKMIGLVCHEHIGPMRHWSVEEQDFANSISDLIAIVIADSERQLADEQLAYQASHDTLTGLVNRREFELRIGNIIEGTKSKEGQEHALCYMDLDQFKVINDTCGHVAGDEMLRQLSAVLESKVRQNDTLARLGGDEFGVLIENCKVDNATRVANSLMETIQNFQFSWEDHLFKVGVSIGLVPINYNVSNLGDLLRDADAACYVAKDKGRNRIHIYDTDDEELSQRHGETQWVARMNKALENGHFCLYAQLIESLSDKNDTNCELLVRMLDDDGSTIPPGAFLPAAERYGLINQIDRWLINKAFRLMSENRAFLLSMGYCSINLSGQSLTEDGLLDFIMQQLKRFEIPADSICFEITETAAISNLSLATKFISTLRNLGCRFALDDFGSGLSSFAYLKSLPVDYLKIDGVFVKDIVEDPIDHAMVKSINEIGQVMNMQTIAEFVENDLIKGMLKEIGVDYAQGYGIGKPQPFTELLQSTNNIIDFKIADGGAQAIGQT